MSRSAATRPRHWWQRRGPSVLVFLVVIGAMAGISALLWRDVAEVLPTVGKDKQGEDPWQDPAGVEKVGNFQIVHIPDCAAAPVVRIEMWDEKSEPYWAVAGPAIPLASFAIGATPKTFHVEVPYRAPAPGAVQRLVVVRSVKGIAGVRFKASDLRTGYVVVGPPLTRYGVTDFQTGDVCGDTGKGKTKNGSKDAGKTTTTAVSGG